MDWALEVVVIQTSCIFMDEPELYQGQLSIYLQAFHPECSGLCLRECILT